MDIITRLEKGSKLTTIEMDNNFIEIRNEKQRLDETIYSLSLKSPIESPTFNGTVTVPTPLTDYEPTTKKYVDSATKTYNYDVLTQHIFTPQDFVIHSDGSISSGNTYYNALIKYQINPLNKYYYSGRFLTYINTIRIAFYDLNEDYIDSSSYTPDVTTSYNQDEILNIPTNAKYISICGGSGTPLFLYYRSYLTSDIKDVVDELYLNRIGNDYVTGINLINVDTCSDTSYISDNSGGTTYNSGAFITGYIKWDENTILRFKTFDSINRNVAYILQYDINKSPITDSFSGLIDTFSFVNKYSGAEYVRVTCFVAGDASFKDPLKWMGYFGNDTTKLFESFYNSKLYNKDSENKVAYFNPDPSLIQKKITTTYLRASRTDTTAGFYGLNAIGDCLASITDNSYYNRYKINVDGHFLFTDPSEFTHIEPLYLEPTVINGKHYVDIEGDGKNTTVISVELSSDSVFPLKTEGVYYTYNDYQPVMWNANAKLSNMTIIGKNCRYALHIESGSVANDSVLEFENLRFRFKGNSEMGASSDTCIGTGIRSGQVWKFNYCEIISDNSSCFGIHTALNTVDKGGRVIFDNCIFDGRMYFHTWPVEKQVDLMIINPIFKSNQYFSYSSYYTSLSNKADYSHIKIKTDTIPKAFDNSTVKGRGLRIKSKSTGVNSIVTVDKDCTAFDSIIGFVSETIMTKTNWLTNLQYGYESRNGAVGVEGYIIGNVDIDESTTHTSLGKKLGDCSTINKTLSLSVDGVSYDIIFDVDCTSLTNTQIITLITDIIGSVATVDTFIVGKEYYPEFDSLKYVTNSDSVVILSGMGVVYSSVKNIRRATTSDGYIDGISLDTFGVGQIGRIIKSGEIYSYNSGQRFRTLEITNTPRTIGDQLGISTTQPGYFDLTTSPKFLRTIDTNILKIL